MPCVPRVHIPIILIFKRRRNAYNVNARHPTQRDHASALIKTKELELERGRLKQELKERTPDLVAQAEENLVDKYCFVDFAAVLLRNRIKALKVK